MSGDSYVPGSPLYGGPVVDQPPDTHRPVPEMVRRTGRRVPWEPISHEADPLVRERRLRRVERDVILHTSQEPCSGCGQTARLSGGTGCTCAAAGADLEKRCLAAAERVRLAGDPWRDHPAARSR
jgi:hypothetical protein